jgi:uncharacterized Zn finger protein
MKCDECGHSEWIVIERWQGGYRVKCGKCGLIKEVNL